MVTNNSSKKEVKATKGPSASRSKKAQTPAQATPTTPTAPRYTTWLKYVVMLVGIVGLVFIMMGTYGTFRALIHQMHAEDVLQNAEKLPPRAPDGSRMPVDSRISGGQSSNVEKAKPVEEAKEVREALKDAEKSVGQSVEQAAKASEPVKPVAKPAASQSGALSQSQIFDPNHPKMAIVIDDIGEDLAAVRALLSLDFPITFAIWPHASHSKKAAMLIYSEGKEIILHQPMQALNDKVDAGEGALHVGMSPAEIRATLQANLALVPHVSGMNNHMGSRFTQDKGIATVCDVLKERGLFALDSVTIASSIFYTEAQKKGLKSARRNVFLDAVSGEKNVLYELHRAEGIAKKKGVAVAIGHPFATTISGLKAWSKVRDKSIRIVRLGDVVH